MTRAEFAKGSTTFLVVIVAGFFSTTYINQRIAVVDTDKKTTSNDRTDAPAPGTPTTACVRKDGSWKNWPWSNVPALSPKCSDDK
jgi:hypothetical protein